MMASICADALRSARRAMTNRMTISAQATIGTAPTVEKPRQVASAADRLSKPTIDNPLVRDERVEYRPGTLDNGGMRVTPPKQVLE